MHVSHHSPMKGRSILLKNMENREPEEVMRISWTASAWGIRNFRYGLRQSWIWQIREKGEIQSGGEYYTKTTKDKIGKFNKLLIFSFWFYNRGGALLKKHTRKKKINKEQPLDAIDPIEIPYLDKIKRKH